MQLTHLLLLLSITLAPSLSQKLTPNAITSLLQGILSPKNTEQVMQMLATVANKKRGLPNSPRTVNRRYAIADNVPRTVMRSEAPNRMAQLVQRPQEMCMKKNAMVQNSNNGMVQNGNQVVLQKNMVVQRRPEAVYPKNIMMVQNSREVTLPRNVIVRNNEMPNRVVVQNNEYSLRVPQMRAPEVVQPKVFVNPQSRPEVQQKVLISQPQATKYVTVPQQKVLIRKDNPFLPAASPVSALAAFSSNTLPPEMPRSRGKYLRKIPIPPPTL